MAVKDVKRYYYAMLAQYLEMKAAGNEPETSADEEYDIFSD